MTESDERRPGDKLMVDGWGRLTEYGADGKDDYSEGVDVLESGSCGRGRRRTDGSILGVARVGVG